MNDNNDDDVDVGEVDGMGWDGMGREDALARQDTAGERRERDSGM